jgi:iron(II)-dependent oxidoreductase
VCNGAGTCFACTPECGQRQCGSNGCGGSCGDCGDPLVCGQDFTCQDVACTGQAGSIQGSLSTDAMVVVFDGVQVDLQHRRDMDPLQDGCIATIDVELTVAGGCRLEVSARGRYLDDDGLEIRSLNWTADQDCPGLAAAGQGLYQGAAGLSQGWIRPGVFEVPGSNVYSACVATGLVIELAGVIFRAGPGDPLTVSPSRIELQGDFTSMGNPLIECPCMSVCAGKQCGDDGCGVACGQCPGQTTFCDDSFQCVDDCALAECGESPQMGYVCGDCPQAHQECLAGVCSCPNLTCQSECCAPAAICYAGVCCQPSCLGRLCGDDGCGGLCGTCPGNLTCQNGRCFGDLDWVPIPAGSFWMGSPNGTGDPSEWPQHLVDVPAFEMLRTEVTAAQYEECFDAVPEQCVGLQSGDGCNFQAEPDHPVNCVNFESARNFCTWAGGRLPSEAEWEYAARSLGQDFVYPWGYASPDCSLVIYDNGGSDSGCLRGGTWPVCSVVAGNTQQGLCDMAGNVAEVVMDHHHDSYDGAPTNGDAWLIPGAPVNAFRVVRGGDWQDPEYNDMRSAKRDPFAPSWTMPFFGFRCVRPPQ